MNETNKQRLSLSHYINEGAQIFLLEAKSYHTPTDIICIDVVLESMHLDNKGISSKFNIYHKNEFTEKREGHIYNFPVKLFLGEEIEIYPEISILYRITRQMPHTGFPRAGMQYILTAKWHVSRGKFEDNLFIPQDPAYEELKQNWKKAKKEINADQRIKYLNNKKTK